MNSCFFYHYPDLTLQTLARVCRFFNGIFTHSLYSTIMLNTNGKYKRLGRSWDKLNVKVPLLLSALQSNPMLLQFVRSLELFENDNWLYTSAPTLQTLAVALSSQLIHLHIEIGHASLLLKFVKQLPKLETLKWTDAPSTYNKNHHEVILHLIVQFSIRTIELHMWSIDGLQHLHRYKADPYPNFLERGPMADPAYRASKGQELIINGADINVSRLEDVFRAARNVEAFSLNVCTHECEQLCLLAHHDDYYEEESCKNAKIADLGQGLRHQRGSLEKLTILQVSPWHCRSDRTVLGVLTSFTKLRYLRIEASYLLGDHPCPTHGFPVQVPPPSPPPPSESAHRLSTLLPSSIERLELRVCSLQKQCSLKWQWTYCNDIIIGLVTEKMAGRLQHLSCIRITESGDCGLQYCYKACAPGRCYRKCGPYVTREEIQSWQKDCGLIGIRLSYLQQGVVGQKWDERSGEATDEWPSPFWIRTYDEDGGVKDFNWEGSEVPLSSLI